MCESVCEGVCDRVCEKEGVCVSVCVEHYVSSAAVFIRLWFGGPVSPLPPRQSGQQ